ncbi:hypothetical protein L208DRAFT_1463431, partial [Tricholoma matsutake]
SDIVCDHMLISRTGLPGKWMGIDKNMEHGIKKNKTLFIAKGVHAGWDRLANISASVDILDEVQQNVAMSLEASYSGTTHTTPNTSAVVWKVTHKACKLKINTFTSDHEGNDSIKSTVDTLATSERLIKCLTLTTFNKKRRNLASGIVLEDLDEVDDIPALDLDVRDGTSDE